MWKLSTVLKGTLRLSVGIDMHYSWQAELATKNCEVQYCKQSGSGIYAHDAYIHVYVYEHGLKFNKNLIILHCTLLLCHCSLKYGGEIYSTVKALPRCHCWMYCIYMFFVCSEVCTLTQCVHVLTVGWREEKEVVSGTQAVHLPVVQAVRLTQY